VPILNYITVLTVSYKTKEAGYIRYFNVVSTLWVQRKVPHFDVLINCTLTRECHVVRGTFCFQESWPLGEDSFDIGRHFQCQILAAPCSAICDRIATRWWRHQRCRRLPVGFPAQRHFEDPDSRYGIVHWVLLERFWGKSDLVSFLLQSSKVKDLRVMSMTLSTFYK
jgi:hypothetical protein